MVGETAKTCGYLYLGDVKDVKTWNGSDLSKDPLDQFLNTYFQLTKAISEEIEECDWDEVIHLLDQREAFIQQEGKWFETASVLPLNDSQQGLLRRIRELDRTNQDKLEEQVGILKKQIHQNRIARQAVRGYLEEGLDRSGLVSTLFNRGV